MKVSVVMPCWITDEEKLGITRNAVFSFKQTAPDAELILIDNGSYMGGGFLRENASIYINYPVNVGFTPVINAGIKMANGDMIALANDDIRVHPNWVEVCSEVLTQPGVATVHPKMIWYNDPFNFGDFTSIGGRERWCHGSFYVTTRKFLDLMRDVERGVEPYPGLYDENYGKGGGGDDWDYVNRIRKIGKQAYTNKTAFQHLRSVTLQRTPDRELIAKQNDEYFTKKWGIKKEELFKLQFPDQAAEEYEKGFL
jgi:glycosyltransferase involved in cell wall biosynthesis